MTVADTLDLTAAARSEWDVAVLGAGPAGALAARELARRGCRTLLVDRACFPRWKVCGCCLNPAALATLQAAELPGLVSALGAIPLQEAWLAGSAGMAEISLPRWVVVSREALDASLIRAAVQAEADLLTGTRADLGAVREEGRQVWLNRNGVTVAVTARVVVVATGLAGTIAGLGKAQRSTAQVNSRIGAGRVADVAPSWYEQGRLYMACSRFGYLGLVRLEDGRLNLAAALEAGVVRRLGSCQAAARRILSEVGWPDSPAEGPWRGTPPLTRRARIVGGHRLFMIGDAAGYVEPFTGEGMAWALATAAAVAPFAARAARCWQANLAAAWQASHRRLLQRRQLVCQAVTASLRRPAMVQTALALLARLPGLAKPLLRHLNTPPWDW